MSDANRAWMPDYLRLFALFGIVIVNVQFMAFSMLTSFPDVFGETTSDRLTLWLVNGLALLKTYGLFSFMFGVGLGFLMRSAERRGLAFGKVYRNRMIGLLFLGILHGCLFFPGDILALYAITGSVLYMMRNMTPAKLARIGIGLLILQSIVAAVFVALGSEPPPTDFMEIEQTALSDGSFRDAIIFRSIGFAIVLIALLFFQGIAALGWFCLGLAAVKSGMIDQADHPLWVRMRRLCLLPGVALSLLGAGLATWGMPLVGGILTVAIAPVATFGYLGLVAWIARPPRPIIARLLKAGGSSLSIYLGQSIILSTIFSGYGFGLWGQVSYSTATLIAVAVTASLILALTLWRSAFRFGPFEWVLRRITYAGQPT